MTRDGIDAISSATLVNLKILSSKLGKIKRCDGEEDECSDWND
jgi:hypothetical protein